MPLMTRPTAKVAPMIAVEKASRETSRDGGGVHSQAPAELPWPPAPPPALSAGEKDDDGKDEEEEEAAP